MSNYIRRNSYKELFSDHEKVDQVFNVIHELSVLALHADSLRHIEHRVNYDFDLDYSSLDEFAELYELGLQIIEKREKQRAVIRRRNELISKFSI